MQLWLVAPSDDDPFPRLVLFHLNSAVGLPLFPVRMSVGEPEHAVMLERDARPRPQCGTEGLALRSYVFQQVRNDNMYPNKRMEARVSG